MPHKLLAALKGGGTRRLRKKHRLGEYVEYGFEVKATFGPDLNEAALDAFLDRFLAFADAHGLASGGGLGPTGMEQYVTGTRPDFRIASRVRGVQPRTWVIARRHARQDEQGRYRAAYPMVFPRRITRRTRGGRQFYTATAADQARVREWLTAQPEVSAVEIGPLVDSWRLPEED